MFKIEFCNKKIILVRKSSLRSLYRRINNSKKKRTKKLCHYRTIKNDYETILYFYITKKLVFYIIYIKDVKKLTSHVNNEIRMLYK